MAIDYSKLTFKQRKWIKEYQETGNATEAAMRAYNVKDRGMASTIGHENIRKLDFEELMDAVGLTEDFLLEKTKEGLNADRYLVKGDKVVKVADHQARAKYMDMTWKLRGRTVTNKVELSGADGGPIQMQVVAGIGFLNKKNVEHTQDTRSGQNDGTSETSTVDGQPQIQGSDLAS